MSSETIINILNTINTNLNIYFGFFILITGIFGQICNVIVFTTLKTFRETTCAFYLTVVSVANFAQALPLLLRVLTSFNVNVSGSAIFCKLRFFSAQYCFLIYLTSMCLATIDQFLSMTKYRHWNNMRLARAQIIFACIFWFIHGIFTFIYYDSNQYTCIITNAVFAKYFAYFYSVILLGFVPVTIMITFSLMAFFKIRTTAVRQQVNHIRLSRDRQLTTMTLFHVLSTVIFITPYASYNVYSLGINATESIQIVRNRLIATVMSLLCYEGYAVS